jgi:hypothetical protein
MTFLFGVATASDPEFKFSTGVFGLVFWAVNAFAAWLAWKSPRRKSDRHRRYPSAAVFMTGLVMSAPWVVLSKQRDTDRLNGLWVSDAWSFGRVAALGLLIIGLVPLFVGFVSLIWPFRWLRAGAGYEARQKRLGAESESSVDASQAKAPSKRNRTSR